jgi:hypothetical protein
MVFSGSYAEGATYYGPLNIHYHDFEEIELADPVYLERMNTLITSVATAVRRSATPIGKGFTRRQTVRRRQEFCKGALSGNVSESDYPRPQITQRNLDESPFLSLPLELRQQIYEYYYLSDVVKIQDLTYDGTYMLTSYKPCSERWPPGRGPTSGVWNNLLGLPLACRIIYPEAIVHLYAKCGFRFTDPGLAIRIPETIPIKCLRSVRSLDFAFFLHLLVSEFKLSEVRALGMKFNSLKPSPSSNCKSNKWLSLWSTVAALPGLKQVSLKLYHQQNDVMQQHYFANATQVLELQPWVSQYILGPLFIFEKDAGPEVVIDLCWRPEDAMYDSLEGRGLKVLLNGRCDRGYGLRV